LFHEDILVLGPQYLFVIFPDARFRNFIHKKDFIWQLPFGECLTEEVSYILSIHCMLKRLQKMLHSRSPNDRAQAAEELGQLGEEARSYVQDLIGALKDPERDVRAKAAVALGFSEAPEAVTPLIQALGDKESVVRSSAVGALSYLKDRRAVQPLIRLLDDQNNEIRDRALRALGRIGDPAAAKPLIRALEESDPYIRWGAAVGLGELGCSEAVDPLMKHALSDEDPGVRWRAIEALGSIGDKRAVQLLLKVIEDEQEDPDILAAAGVALKRINIVDNANL
jgi:HEAT repeat protein